MALVIELKRAIQGINSLIKNQWYVDHTDLINLREKLKTRLAVTEELLHLGELPDAVIEEWAELTDDQLKLMGIKKIIL